MGPPPGREGLVNSAPGSVPAALRAGAAENRPPAAEKRGGFNFPTQNPSFRALGEEIRGPGDVLRASGCPPWTPAKPSGHPDGFAGTPDAASGRADVPSPARRENPGA